MKDQVIKAVISARGFVIKNSPTILSGLAISGLLATAYFTHEAAIKAYKKLEEEDLEKANWQEKAKATWGIYAPPVVMGAVTSACIVGSNVISLKRTAALTSLYTISEAALREYQAKTAEIVGDKKAESIREAITKQKTKDEPTENIFFTGQGEDLCYDNLSGRYFYSDINAIRAAVNELNRRLFSDMSVSLNDLYYELGLTAIGFGDEVGWTIETPIELAYDSHLTSKGTPVLVMDYRQWPIILYRDR